MSLFPTSSHHSLQRSEHLLRSPYLFNQKNIEHVLFLALYSFMLYDMLYA